MHPNVFLKSFWQMELRPQVFVAMSFSPQYQGRYEKVIAPAINAISVNGMPLSPYRVDLSKSGDSILTDIMDGIAHSQMILADISSVGKDLVTGFPYRNGNVMYEVGIALASRQPQEVLLIRDDHDKFLFDVSTIPHMTIDFTETEPARHKLQLELMARLKEQNFVNDVRIQMAIASLSIEEVSLIKIFADLPTGSAWGFRDERSINFLAMAAIPRLLDKRVIRVAGQFEEGHPAYILTPLGAVVANLIKSGLRQFKADPPKHQASVTETPEEKTEPAEGGSA